MGRSQLLQLEITQNWETFITQTKHMIFDKIKSFWKLMIWFCYFCKKIVFFFWVWPMRTPILHKFSQKMLIFRGFSKFFFRTTGFQLKLMILIASPNIFHWKPAKKIKVGLVLRQNLGQIRPNVVKKVKKLVFVNRFFFIFYMGIPFKAKSSGCTYTWVEIYGKYS